MEEKNFDDSSLRKFGSRISDDIKVRDEAVNIRTQLQEETSKSEEEVKEEHLEELLKKASETISILDKRIEQIDDFIKRERAVYESLRTLTWIRKISSIIGGFLLFFGGVLLTLSILFVTKILILPATINAQVFIGYLMLVASITMLLSGTIHQVV